MARAAIFGLAGPVPTAEELAFFADADPWGFILFARNIETPDQVRRLTTRLRVAVGRPAPILIDQEGGRVARLRGPHWHDWAAPRADAAAGPEALALRYRLIAAELTDLGIDVDCMPLLDVPQPGAHPVIGDRALGDSPAEVAALGRAVCDGLRAGGVLPVLKHLPGHGRAGVDSHADLPRVDARLDALRDIDFAAFRPLAGESLGMTAHVVFDALDPDLPATLSPACIRAIRDDIGFGGALMTDDLGMGALTGPMRDRGDLAIAAGCDLLLHCNGERAEMQAVAEAAPELAGLALGRTERALASRQPPQPLDRAAALARHAALTRAHA